MVAQTTCGVSAAEPRLQMTNALHCFGYIDPDGLGRRHTYILGIAHLLIQPCGANERLRGHAADVQTIAAEKIALDERDLPAKRCRTAGRQHPGGALSLIHI